MIRTTQLMATVMVAAIAVAGWSQEKSAPAPASKPTAHAIIITGLGGGKTYTRNLLDWSARFSKLLTTRCGLPAAHITVLAETADPKATPPRAKATLENIRAAFSRAAGRVGKNDRFILFIAGLGQVNEEVGKLCLPGVDLRADELEEMLRMVRANGWDTRSTSSPSGTNCAGASRLACSSPWL